MKTVRGTHPTDCVPASPREPMLFLILCGSVAPWLCVRHIPAWIPASAGMTDKKRGFRPGVYRLEATSRWVCCGIPMTAIILIRRA